MNLVGSQPSLGAAVGVLEVLQEHPGPDRPRLIILDHPIAQVDLVFGAKDDYLADRPRWDPVRLIQQLGAKGVKGSRSFRTGRLCFIPNAWGYLLYYNSSRNQQCR